MTPYQKSSKPLECIKTGKQTNPFVKDGGLRTVPRPEIGNVSGFICGKHAVDLGVATHPNVINWPNADLGGPIVQLLLISNLVP